MRDVTTALRWRRFAVVEVIQVPCVLLAIVGAWPWALFTAALVGSVICAAGTDSASGPGARLARWLNRVLVLQAVAWLTIALVFCLPS
ncbi:MAG TPA: hypothetical protein VHX44_01650 [Planctomycetota bacterium]|nr:hypothetical protein [Planctomycetota bacterium]